MRARTQSVNPAELFRFESQINEIVVEIEIEIEVNNILSCTVYILILFVLYLQYRNYEYRIVYLN